MTLQTEILSTETSGLLKQIIFLKSFISVFYGLCMIRATDDLGFVKTLNYLNSF